MHNCIALYTLGYLIQNGRKFKLSMLFIMRKVVKHSKHGIIPFIALSRHFFTMKLECWKPFP